MKWCCPFFEEWVRRCDSRGFSFAVDRDLGGDKRIALQFRAVDRDVKITETGGVLLNVIGRARIAYCPFCGRKIERSYKNVIDLLPETEPLEDQKEGHS